MKRVFRTTWLIPALAIGLAAISCKRETRSFHAPSAATDMPEDVPYQDRVRAGATTQPGEGIPVNISRFANETYGTQFPGNAAALADGQRLFSQMNCSGCHANGGGGMGPPLLDNEWFYGSDPANVYMTILLGRPGGMPSFRGRLPSYEIWKLVAYVRSLSGLANPQAAPGRSDHLRANPPPNSMPPHEPGTVQPPATGPATNQVAR